MMQARYTGRLESGIRVPRRNLGVMISPVLAQGFKSYEKEKAAQLEDLFFPFSSLSGAIMCSPEHLNTIPATTKNNMI